MYVVVCIAFWCAFFSVAFFFLMSLRRGKSFYDFFSCYKGGNVFFSKGVKSSDGGCVMSLIRSPVHQQSQNSGFSFYKDVALLVEKRLSPPRI